MRSLLDFDDAGADRHQPVTGVTVGDIRSWFDEIERLHEIIMTLRAAETERITPSGHILEVT